MGAREGAGNFVTGFLSAFDPNAFTRSYQRAQDRAERAKTRKEDRTWQQEQEENRRLWRMEESDRQAGLIPGTPRYRERIGKIAKTKADEKRKARLNRYNQIWKSLSDRKSPRSLDYLESIRPEFFKARTEAEIVNLLKPLQGEKGFRAIDLKNYEKLQIERRKAAARITSRSVSIDNRLKELREFTRPSGTSNSISRSLSERLPTKRKDLNPGWFADKVKAKYRAYAAPRIQQGADVQYFDEFENQIKNSGVGYILDNERVPLDSATRYLLRDVENGRPVSAAKFRAAAQRASSPEQAVDSFSLLSNVDASARVYLVEQAKKFMPRKIKARQ